MTRTAGELSPLTARLPSGEKATPLTLPESISITRMGWKTRRPMELTSRRGLQTNLEVGRAEGLVQFLERARADLFQGGAGGLAAQAAVFSAQLPDQGGNVAPWGEGGATRMCNGTRRTTRA